MEYLNPRLLVVRDLVDYIALPQMAQTEDGKTAKKILTSECMCNSCTGMSDVVCYIPPRNLTRGRLHFARSQ